MLRSKSVIDLISPGTFEVPRDVDKLPVASGEQDVLVTHPALEVVAPVLLFNRVPALAEATRPVRDAFDHTHRSHRPLSAIASLLPSTSELVNGR